MRLSAGRIIPVANTSVLSAPGGLAFAPCVTHRPYRLAHRMTGTERLISTAEGTLRTSFGRVEWSLLLATAVMWGSSYLLIAVALEGLRPLAVAFLRVAFGLGVVAMLPAARRGSVARSDGARVAVLGVLWLALPLALYPIAQRHADSSVAGMITGSQPIVSAVIAATLLRRRPESGVKCGLAVGFAGVVLVVSASTSGSNAASLGGVILILVAVACYALATNLAVPLQQRYGALAVIVRALLVAFVLLTVPGIIALLQSEPRIGSLAATFVLGVVSTGAGYVTFTTLVGRAGATRGAVAIYLVPIVAIVLGVVFRGERPSALALAGAALVTAGALLVGRSRR
jgi:drug/metabolite transporter (DMT)-like permease